MLFLIISPTLRLTFIYLLVYYFVSLNTFIHYFFIRIFIALLFCCPYLSREVEGSGAPGQDLCCWGFLPPGPVDTRSAPWGMLRSRIDTCLVPVFASGCEGLTPGFN